MIKLVVLYKKPVDPEAFDRYYFDTHLTFAKQLPGIVRLEVAKVQPAPTDDEGFYMVSELCFDDGAALAAAMQSTEGQQLRADTANVASDDRIVRLVCAVS
jgi:uncharacterized protein (TIGR02118 family)